MFIQRDLIRILKRRRYRESSVACVDHKMTANAGRFLLTLSYQKASSEMIQTQGEKQPCEYYTLGTGSYSSHTYSILHLYARAVKRGAPRQRYQITDALSR